jgi:hypothetical protein
MIDLCLCAETEADMIAALPFLRGTDQDGQPCWLTAGAGHSLDLIGPLETAPAVIGIIDGLPEVRTPAVVDARYHVNLRCLPEMAARIPPEIVVAPAAPRRVFA